MKVCFSSELMGFLIILNSNSKDFSYPIQDSFQYSPIINQELIKETFMKYFVFWIGEFMNLNPIQFNFTHLDLNLIKIYLDLRILKPFHLIVY